MVVLTSLASAGISGSRSSTLGAAETAAAAGAAGAASALGAGAGATSSPARRAIGVLTFTFSEPSGTRISSTSPSSTASTSIVALSVSISAITWPADTVSPALICHLVSVPSSIVGDSAGIRMSVTDQAST
ncbi:hypothetical protein D9M71_709500 [compost metagenome]